MVRFGLVHVPKWDDSLQDTKKVDVLHLFSESEGRQSVKEATEQDKLDYAVEYAEFLNTQGAK